MPKIFLSYAEEDGNFAWEIIALLREILGDQWEILFWEDPKQRGQRWIDKIENDILEANAFLALISPYYLTSPWCIHERNLALRRDVEFQKDGKQFLWVAQVVSTEKTGLIANYDWLDLSKPGWSEILKTSFIEGLNKMEVSGIKLNPARKEPAAFPTFENRREELDDLIANLTNVAGKHFWLFLSTPQMGKSWLLERLPIELSEKDPNWQIVRVDLREQPADVRSNLSKLISIYFKQKSRKPNNKNQITEFARELASRNICLLLILDSAELLSDDTAKALREYLSEIHKLLEESGKPARLAFIAASRRQIPGWRSVIPTPVIGSRTLSHFTVGVIETFLRKMAKMDGCDKDNRWFKHTSQQLSRASEGLPGLLVKYMEWIRNNGYIIRPGINSHTLFSSLARPYIENHLLSAHSLLPSSPDSDLIEPRRALLEKTLLNLSIYRCFTERNFHQFMDDHNGLKDDLDRAEYNRDQLWYDLKRTYLMEPILDIWIRFYPAVRRLLLRYQHPNREKQFEAHQKALGFYNESQASLSGTDKAIILIEHLWHYVEYQRLSDPRPDPSNLRTFAENLFRDGIQSNHHTDRDLAVLIEERLLSDMELQVSLAEIQKDLFANFVSIVNSYT